MMGWYGSGTWGWGGWLMMTLVMVSFWAVVVWGLVAIFRGSSRDTDSAASTRRRDPMEILDERFARGEVDAEEYRARQAVLRATTH